MQIEEAEAFLIMHKIKLKNIADIKEIEGVGIDFGADDFMENGMVKTFYFPPALITLCSELKFSIEISVYTA